MVSPKRSGMRNLFWPLSAAGAVTNGLLTTTLTRTDHDFDRAALNREQALVENGFAAKVAEIGHQVLPQAVWDDAVVHLDNRFDRQWAHDNIGQFLSPIDGFTFAYVLDPLDRPVYGMNKGEDVSPGTYDQYQPLLAAMVERVRRLEAAAPPEAGPGRVGRPVQVNSAKVLDGRVIIFSVTRVQSDFGQARLRGPRAPIIITGREVDASLLGGFSARYMPTQLPLHPADSRGAPE